MDSAPWSKQVSGWLGNLLYNFIHMLCTNLFKYEVHVTDTEDLIFDVHHDHA